MSDGGGGMSGAADAAANFRAPHHGGGGGGGGTSGAASGPSDGASGGVKKPYLFTRELTGSWENKYGFPVHKRDLDALVDMTTDGWTLLCDENGFKKDNLTVQLQYYAEPTRKTLLRISGFNKFVKSLPQNKVKGAVEFGLKATEAKQLIFYRLSEDGGDGGGVASNNAAALPIIPAPAPQKLPPKYQWKLRNANVHSDSSKQVALEDEAPAKAERGKQIRTRAQAKHVAPEDEAEQDKAPTKQRGKHVQGSIRIRTRAQAKHVAPDEAPAKQVVQRGKHVQGSIRIRTRAQKAMLDREDRDVALNHLQGAIDLLARLVEFKEQIKTKDELDLLLASLKSGMDWSPEVAMDMLRKTEGRDLLVILEKKKEKMVVEAEREQDEESLAQPSVIQQVLNVAKVIEEQLDDEISKLERLDDDDLMQMKQMAAKRQQWMAQGHGEYQEILSEKDFFAAAKASDRVVCHFYRENWPCKVMDKHLNILSKQHLETRFVKINAEKSPFLTERLKILMLPTLALIKNVMLPTLALIKKGKVDDYVVGFDELGGTDEFSTEELEERLARSKIIMADGQSAGDRSKATTTATATSKADTSAKNAKADEEYVRVHLSVGAPPC